MNQPHKDKKKFTYNENKLVFDTLKWIAAEETKTLGREVTMPEVIRTETLKVANKYRREHGQPPIKYDTSGGKFAPPNATSATVCTIDSQGNMDVRERRGNKMTQWKHVKQLPELLRSYPKCKVLYRHQLRNVLDYL